MYTLHRDVAISCRLEKNQQVIRYVDQVPQIIDFQGRYTSSS